MAAALALPGTVARNEPRLSRRFKNKGPPMGQRLLLALLLCIAGVLRADSIQTKLGDRFKGRVVREDAQQVVFRTEYGELTIPRADVKKHERATFAPRIARGELTVDWARPAAALARLVRALSPRPGARTTRRGELLKVLSAEEGKNVGGEKGIPGRVTEVTKDGFSVESGSGLLRVRRVQPAGRKVMSAGEYVKGYRLRPGEVLGTERECGEG